MMHWLLKSERFVEFPKILLNLSNAAQNRNLEDSIKSSRSNFLISDVIPIEITELYMLAILVTHIYT